MSSEKLNKNTPLSEEELSGVSGGVDFNPPAPPQRDPDELCGTKTGPGRTVKPYDCCGKYHPKNGKENETAQCEFCVHSYQVRGGDCCCDLE